MNPSATTNGTITIMLVRMMRGYASARPRALHASAIQPADKQAERASADHDRAERPAGARGGIAKRPNQVRRAPQVQRIDDHHVHRDADDVRAVRAAPLQHIRDDLAHRQMRTAHRDEPAAPNRFAHRAHQQRDQRAPASRREKTRAASRTVRRATVASRCRGFAPIARRCRRPCTQCRSRASRRSCRSTARAPAFRARNSR